MVKRAFLVVVTLAAFAGCGDDSSSGAVGSGGSPASGGDASAAMSSSDLGPSAIDLSSSVFDLASKPATDLATSTADASTAALTGCNGLRACENACKSDKTCAAGCRANATSTAKKLYQALLDCHDQVCGPPTTGKCTSNCNCRPASDAAGGACNAQYTACITNLP